MTKSQVRDIIVLDTSVILYDSECITKFDGYDLVVPLIVLDEIDKFRKNDNQIGRNARRFIRNLKALKNKTQGGYSGGMKRKETGEIIRIHKLNNPAYLDGIVLVKDKNDDKIIAVCLELVKAYPDRSVWLSTKDIALNVKASTLGIKDKDYNESVLISDDTGLYSGTYEFPVESKVIDTLYNSGEVPSSMVEESLGLYSNAGVCLKSPHDKHETALTIYKEGKFKLLSKNYSKVHNIAPKNQEQSYAMELLLDPNIRLVSLTGLAGSGKTLLAVACALSQVDARMYDKLIISRPIQPLGNDLGYLPGPQPLDAGILTPSGWTTMGSLKVGDKITAKDGTVTSVTGVFPKGIKPVYKVTTTEGTFTECCKDHLWYTTTAEKRKRGKEGDVKTTEEIMESLESTLPGKKLNGHKPRYGSIRPNHFLPRNEAVNFYKKDLVLPPYTLGSILGDGCIGNSVSVSSTDSEIIERIRSELILYGIGCSLVYDGLINYRFSGEYLNNKPAKTVKISNINKEGFNTYKTIGVASKETGINLSTLKSRCRDNLTIDSHEYSFLPCSKRYQNPIKNYLFNLGLENKKAWEKFIPEDYLYSSMEDRISLLQGLMDTDGTVKKSTGEASFCTTSKRLAEGMVYLVRSLGGRAVIKSRDRRGKRSKIGGRVVQTKRISYEFTISLPKGVNPFYLERKAERFKSSRMHDIGVVSVDYVGEKEVQCILIDHPDHLYITDDYIVTHNTVEEKLGPWMSPIVDAVEFVFGGDRNKYNQLIDYGSLEIEPLTYIRGRSMPNTIFVLDESQNVSPHEMKTIITRIGKDSKIILTGDVFQIDNNYLDMTSNGLTYAVEKFKYHDIAGHITFTKGQRSRLATLAAEIL